MIHFANTFQQANGCLRLKELASGSRTKSYSHMATSILSVFLLNSVLFLKLKISFIHLAKRKKQRKKERKFLGVVSSQIFVLMAQPEEP